MVSRALAVIVGVGAFLLAGTALPDRRGLPGTELGIAGYDTCGFLYVNERRITNRKNISCAGAKRVLRQLRANRHTYTVPMVCRDPRVFRGWRITNVGRSPGLVQNRYQRGRVSLQYNRVQSPVPQRAFCPPIGPGEDVGGW